MPLFYWLLALCCLLLPLVFGLWRASELCVLVERRGKLSVLRGRMPNTLFSDLEEIADRWPLGATQLHIVSEAGIPRLLVKGADNPALVQAVRNVLGRFNVAQIRAGKRRAR